MNEAGFWLTMMMGRPRDNSPSTVILRKPLVSPTSSSSHQHFFAKRPQVPPAVSRSRKLRNPSVEPLPTLDFVARFCILEGALTGVGIFLSLSLSPPPRSKFRGCVAVTLDSHNPLLPLRLPSYLYVITDPDLENRKGVGWGVWGKWH